VSALLTLDEVARELTLSRRTVERLVRSGRIRTVRPSPGRVAVERREVDAYLAWMRRAAA
jgi:excisionase family DNA binding protein